eukprot:4001563-Pyramimonas_sp.AAC.1
MANPTVVVSDPFYLPCVRQIRACLADCSTSAFGCKGGYLEPVVWRPREWNTGTYYLVNLAMSAQSNGRGLNADIVRRAIASGETLQMFPGGGHNGEAWASGVQAITHRTRGAHMIGYVHVYVPDALSAF